MSNAVKICIVVALAGAIVCVVALSQSDRVSPPEEPAPTQTAGQPPQQAEAPLPRLLDLGAVKCIPCKLMAPILEELGKEYQGRLHVEFIDVSKNPSAAQKYDVSLIPTQIFFDASGKELFRHQGFLSKADILKTWQELGVSLEGGPKPQQKPRRQVPSCATGGAT